MEFLIKCHLGYDVSGPASFLFNVAVAQIRFSASITEHFEVRGVEYSQEMTIGGQRYHRVTAQSGRFELIYEAVVDATHEKFGDSSDFKSPFEQIPAEAMVFIYPAAFVSLIYWLDWQTRVQSRRVCSSELRRYVIDLRTN
jgi:hypothetical protein